KTLASLLKSVGFYTVFFVAGMMVLESIGINTASLLAAAGVAGLAIGFGAQNLVKDVVSGFFILFEGQFRVGDYVGIGNVEGVVEQTGLRTTWIRSFGGEVHIIPNGEVRSEEHTSELQSRENLVCRLLLEKKNRRGRREYSSD